MPPKTPSLDEVPPAAILPLQDWLKLLSGRGVDMRVAMTLAAKMYVVIVLHHFLVDPGQLKKADGVQIQQP